MSPRYLWLSMPLAALAAPLLVLGACQPSAPRAVAGDAPAIPPAASGSSRGDRPAPSVSAPTSQGPCPPEMLHVSGGTFRMGDDTGEPDEKPAHDVVVAPFCIDRTEVTAAAYQDCVQAKKCEPPGAVTVSSDPPLCNLGRADRGQHPMNCVDRAEAARFCAQRGGRLPTEEEWEVAARGTDGRSHPWGSASPTGRACVGTETCAVGSFPKQASPFGLLDMAGNVRELTASLSCPYAPADAQCPPWSPTASRGGSFRSSLRDLRATARAGESIGERTASLGFRCVVGGPLPPPRAQPDNVQRMCDCFKKHYAQPSCDTPETQFIGGADPDCVRTYANDCSMMIACSRGEPGAAPKCLPGFKPWGAMRSCARACKRDADCRADEACSKEWGMACVPR